MITSEYSGPKKLEFELPFGKCKYKCKFCSNYGGETVVPPLTKEKAFKVVDDFIEIGGDTLVVISGESLECPFCWELIRYAKTKGLKYMFIQQVIWSIKRLARGSVPWVLIGYM